MSDRVGILKSALKLFPAQAKNMDDDALMLLVLSTANVPDDAFRSAVAQAVNDPQFMLHIPSSIQDAYRKMAPGSSLTVPTPEEAWGEIQNRIRSVGYVGTPSWSHPVIGEMVRGMGGWQQLCASETPLADRAHFLKMYASRVERSQEVASLTPGARRIAEKNGLNVAGLIEHVTKQISMKGNRDGD